MVEEDYAMSELTRANTSKDGMVNDAVCTYLVEAVNNGVGT